MTDFDLDAYRQRIALEIMPGPDAAGLALLQHAHRLAIGFENLDVVLGRPVLIDPARVFNKLVTQRRGGWCFENNALFADALAAIGLPSKGLLARVWLGREGNEPPPRTHTLRLVRVEGVDWIADAGFGGSYTPPLPLIDGAEARTADGARHWLARDPVHGWMLWRDGDVRQTDGRATGAGPQRQYSFTAEPVADDAIAALARDFAARPGRFTTTALVSVPLPSGFASLTNRRYRRATTAEVVEAEITSPVVYRMRLSLLFGIDLPAADVAGLGLFPA